MRPTKERITEALHQWEEKALAEAGTARDLGDFKTASAKMDVAIAYLQARHLVENEFLKEQS